MLWNIFSVKKGIVVSSVAFTLKVTSVSIRGKLAVFDYDRHFLILIDEHKPSSTSILIPEM